jgi:hypothetical protein
MTRDNGQSYEAQEIRQESEFIKRIEDFARYMAPEYITGSDNPRSLCIIAGDCLDEREGKFAMAHIMVGDNRVARGALRSMMESSEDFASQVHELCDDDDSRSVDDLDEEIGRKQKRLTRSTWLAVVIAAWSAVLIAFPLVGLSNWITTVSSLLLMALCGMFICHDIKTLRADIARLKQLRKRAVGRQKMMTYREHLAGFLRQIRAQIEEDAGEDEDD